MIDIQRCPVAPASLANQSSWSSNDVREKLWEDFNGKCYLTESLVSMESLSVDHFQPRASFANLIYEWTNLFPTDRNANERRPKNWPAGGLLDPSANENVESRLQQYLDSDSIPHFCARDSTDTKAVNTAVQLEHIHNDTKPKAAELRNAINKYLTRVLEKLLALQRAKKEENDAEIVRLENEVRKMLSKKAPYTSLIRSRVQSVWPHDAYFD